jgi:glycerol-3-phosphate dehydrogenase
LITITGGKLTTYRRMAKMAVDRLVERDGRTAPCRTHDVPLGAPADPADLPVLDGLPTEAYGALAARYGHEARRVLAEASGHPDLAGPIVEGLPDLLAEARYAAAYEQARTVGDVLLRRTRVGLLAGRAVSAAASDAPQLVARAMSAELGWDEARIAAEVRDWGDEARAEGIAGEPGL